MTLFEYAIIYVPNEKQLNKGEAAQILVKPTVVLAKDASAVQLLAAKKIPDEFDSKLEFVKVAVRPF